MMCSVENIPDKDGCSWDRRPESYRKDEGAQSPHVAQTRKDFLCEVPKPSLDGSVDMLCHVLASITQTLGGLVMSHRLALWREAQVPGPD